MKTVSAYGPITFKDMQIEVSENGIQAKDYCFNADKAAKPHPWEAEWIWLDKNKFYEHQESSYTVFCGHKGKKYGVALFRKEFLIKGEVKSAVAWVSADVKYRMLINGQKAGRGPAEVGGDYGNTEALDYWFYDFYDLMGFLNEGNNTIAAEVLLQPDVQADYSMGHGGFLFEMLIEHIDGSTTCIKTDGTWKGTLNRASVSINHYDARMDMGRWESIDYDDSEWPLAEVIDKASGGRWKLRPREIPPLMEAAILPVRILTPFEEHAGRISNRTSLMCDNASAATISSGSPMTFWLDFGRVLSGRIYLKASGAAGTIITIGTQEIIGKTDRVEACIMKDGPQEYESIRLHSVHYLQITISNMTGPIELYNLDINFTSYPVSYAGDFKCSDDVLNRVYQAGRWSNQLCMQAYHMDSPIHQEALGCTGDYMIESLINYYTFGDSWLTRLDLLRTAWLLEKKKGLMFHTSYSLLWLQMLADYHLYTGDASIFKAVMPMVHMLLDRFEGYLGEAGLIENAPDYMFMDWVPAGRYNLHHPPKAMGMSYMTAFYYKALKNGIALCEVVGDKGKAEHWENIATKVKAAFNKELWVGEKGLYCDGRNGKTPSKANSWLPEDINGVYFSQHTNALAVLYDIAPKERHMAIMCKVFQDTALSQAQPYFMHFVLDAAAHAGVFDEYGFEQMRRWNVLLKENPSSLKEVWAGFDCDYSHAWGGTPTYQLPSKVLGIIPLQPGFEKIGISPVFGDLEWAAGVAPTPKGYVSVEWKRNGNGIDIDVTVPEEAAVELFIPKTIEHTATITHRKR